MGQQRWSLGLLMLSVMCSSSTWADTHSPPQGTAKLLRSDGFALEVQGLQSHHTAIEDYGDWFAESKFNEQGLALRWEFSNQWFIEGRLSRGEHLRYFIEVGEDENGDPQFEDEQGRTRGASFGVGKRMWLNQYFSVRPQLNYMWRDRDTPQLYSDFNQQRLPAYRTQEHNVGAGIAAEYRVIRHVAVSLNFTLLSSGERQQGIGIAYYFY